MGFQLNVIEFDRLHQSMQNFQGNTEKAINEVLHEEVSPLVQDAIKRLIPVSGKHWRGKSPAAKTAKSLRDIKANVSLTVTTTKKYQYLYFPDDGTSTTRHVGNQQFFKKGGESQQDEIVNRCIKKLVNGFEGAVN